jgi:cell division protein FtsZ
VGNVVRQFAADDATIVVGTAIDEALEGELRVTVVATGLGHPQQQQSQLRAVQHSVQHSVQQPRVAAAGGGLQYGSAGNAAAQYGSNNGATAQYGGSTAGGAPHYNSAGSQYANYDKPTVIRKTARGVASGTGPANSGHDVEYLDIPAFLRRQAD